MKSTAQSLRVKISDAFLQSNLPLTEQTRESLVRYKGKGFTHNPSLHVRVDTELWGCEVSATISSSREVSVSWSATDRTIAMAVATIDLYERTVKVAAYCEGLIQTTTIIPDEK